jgi:hypothetical protein
MKYVIFFQEHKCFTDQKHLAKRVNVTSCFGSPTGVRFGTSFVPIFI